MKRINCITNIKIIIIKTNEIFISNHIFLTTEHSLNYNLSESRAYKNTRYLELPQPLLFQVVPNPFKLKRYCLISVCVRHEINYTMITIK